MRRRHLGAQRRRRAVVELLHRRRERAAPLEALLARAERERRARDAHKADVDVARPLPEELGLLFMVGGRGVMTIAALF